MIDRMGLRDGFAVQLGCGHHGPRYLTEDGKILCNSCGEEIVEARMTEQDERNGADTNEGQ